MSRRRFSPLTVAALAAAVLAVLGGVVVATRLGHYLVVSDPLASSDAIVVLDGRTPARELEAAALYERGLAPRVIVSLPRDLLPEAARQLSGLPASQEQAVRVLRHRGVPAEAIVRMPTVVDNTEQELAVDFEYAQQQGFRRLIVVTSPPHTRRVRIVWNARYQADVAALVHPTPYDPFDAARWWHSRYSLEAAVHEAGGIVNFLLGSPLPTFQRRS